MPIQFLWGGKDMPDDAVDEIQKKAQEALNKRRFERFKAGLQVKFRPISRGEKQSLLKSGGYARPGAFMAKAAETQDLSHVVSEDLSQGGLRLTLPAPMQQGDELWINLKLPQVPIPVNAIAVVMWSRPAGAAFSAGLKFEAINKDDLERVEKFLALQKGAA